MAWQWGRRYCSSSEIFKVDCAIKGHIELVGEPKVYKAISQEGLIKCGGKLVDSLTSFWAPVAYSVYLRAFGPGNEPWLKQPLFFNIKKINSNDTVELFPTVFGRIEPAEKDKDTRKVIIGILQETIEIEVNITTTW